MKSYSGILIPVIISALFSCKSSKQVNAANTNEDRSRLEERYWRLIEVNGNQVDPTGGGQHEPHMTLKAEQKRVVGHGGCNSFSGVYELKEGSRLAFSDIISTKTACDKLTIENQFFHALNSADSYHINGDTLLLHKAKMAPLAKFVLVVSD